MVEGEAFHTYALDDEAEALRAACAAADEDAALDTLARARADGVHQDGYDVGAQYSAVAAGLVPPGYQLHCSKGTTGGVTMASFGATGTDLPLLLADPSYSAGGGGGGGGVDVAPVEFSDEVLVLLAARGEQDARLETLGRAAAAPRSVSAAVQAVDGPEAPCTPRPPSTPGGGVDACARSGGVLTGEPGDAGGSGCESVDGEAQAEAHGTAHAGRGARSALPLHAFGGSEVVHARKRKSALIGKQLSDLQAESKRLHEASVHLQRRALEMQRAAGIPVTPELALALAADGGTAAEQPCGTAEQAHGGTAAEQADGARGATTVPSGGTCLEAGAEAGRGAVPSSPRAAAAAPPRPAAMIGWELPGSPIKGKAAVHAARMAPLPAPRERDHATHTVWAEASGRELPLLGSPARAGAQKPRETVCNCRCKPLLGGAAAVGTLKLADAVRKHSWKHCF